MKLLLLVLAALAAISNAYGQNRGVAYVDTLATLDAMRPIPGMTVYVRGATNVNDWGDTPLPFTYVAGSSNAVDRFCRPTGTGIGRFIHNWNGNVEAFGAIPYDAQYNIMPWGYQTNGVNAIGTGDFSIWARVKIPAAITDPIGMFSLGVSPQNTNGVSAYSAASLCLRASSSVFGFLFRGTNSASSPGSLLNDPSTLDSTPAALSSYLGTTVDLVFTRAGTNVKVYLNGSDQTTLFTNNNPAGWAKSLAIGTPLLVSVARQENRWYWPEPISRFAVWNSALSSSQAANPSATGSKIVDFTSPTVTVPAEASTGINAALAYLAERGGGIARLADGCYRIGLPIRGRPNTFLVGAGSAFYPNPVTFVEGFVPSGTSLVPWFGNEGDICQTLRSDGGESYFAPVRNAGGVASYTNASANTYTTMSKSGFRDFAIMGDLAKYGRAFFADRVGSVNYENLGVSYFPGPALYSVQGNSIMVRGFSGTYGRGIIIRGNADCIFSDIHFDGPTGPAFWLYGNLNNIDNIVAEFTTDPRSNANLFEPTATVDISTDTFTTPSYHKFSTGDIVRFTTDTGTLPGPVTTNVDYFVYRVSSTTFKIGYKYSDDISFDGVMNGAGFLDITNSGSGTWYVGPGPAVGMLLWGDNNGINNFRTQRNFKEALRLENSYENTITGSRMMLSGYQNTNLSGLAVVGLYNSKSNTFGNNTVTDRNLTGYATNGVYFDPGSIGNVFSGTMRYSTTPNWNKYIGSGPPTNRWTDADTEIVGAVGSRPNFLLPSVAGFTQYADERAVGFSRPMLYDTSGRRVFVARDNTSGNWDYMHTFPFSGPIYWNSLTANGAMQAVNGGAAATELYLRGEGFNPMLSIQGWSTNYFSRGTTPSIGLQRHMGTNSSNYQVVSNGVYMGGYTMGGFYTNNANGGTYSDTGIYGKATETWSTGARGAELELVATQNGGTTLSIGMIAKPNGTINLPFQSSAPIVNVVDGDMFYGANAGTTNLWIRRAGAWVGAL